MRLAVVVPRYGERVLGGAETFAREFVEHLPTEEFEVEVLTTCAEDLLTWRNTLPPGAVQVNGVLVRRFPIEHRGRDVRRFRDALRKFTQGWPTNAEDEEAWIEHSPHSPALYAHISRWGPRYDLLIFLPYPFGITFYSSALWPRRSVLWPCLHDEPFARMLHTRLMMEACRGVMFMTEPEMRLAVEQLGIRSRSARIVGFGMDEFTADPERFRRHWGIREPFLLYSGRLESVKNLLELGSFFLEYKRVRPGPLKLVLMGAGPLVFPRHADVIHVGYLTGQDKRDAYAAATVLCQPSLLESFSIVLMEGWLAGVPALVHGDCEVTRYHVQRCSGGLYYAGFEEFASTLDWMLEHPSERQRMGQQGQAYVRREYNWPAVLSRFRSALEEWTGR